MILDRLRPAARALWEFGDDASGAAGQGLLFLDAVLRDPYRTALSPADLGRCYRHGFLPKLFALYDFETYDRADYLNYFQRDRVDHLNPYRVSEHKYSFDRILRHDFEEFLPEVHAVVRDSGVYAPDRTLLASELRPWVRDRVTDDRQFVFKPTHAHGGDGVFVVGRDADGLRIATPGSGEPTLDDLEAHVAGAGPYFVTDFVEQAGYSAELYPHATNTLRMITLWDDDAGEPFLADAIHRVGTDRSRPVDNCSEGGLTVGVDLDAGTLQRGVVDPAIADIEWHATHPDTGARIEGTRIPNWEAIRREVCELATEIWYMPFAAWDVVVTPDGFRVVECNFTSALGMVQAHRPLLCDDRTRRFFRRHGLVD